MKSRLDGITNARLEELIDAYIHNAVYRAILKDRLIDGLTFEAIAEKRGYSDRHVKRIVYKAEDKLFAMIDK